MPCGVHGRCLVLSAAPRGYMCMCQNEGLAYTTIDTCPPPNTFCTPMSCQNGGTCIPYSEQERACSIAQTGSTCCLCKRSMRKENHPHTIDNFYLKVHRTSRVFVVNEC